MCSYISIAISRSKCILYLYVDLRFVELLQYRSRRSDDCTTLSDIYDGSIYKERSNFYSDPYNLSFTMNIDGAPKFKSSTMQIWPVQMIINELPPMARLAMLMTGS